MLNEVDNYYEIKNIVFDFNGVIAGFKKTGVLNKVNLRDVCNLIRFSFSYLTNSGFRGELKYAYHGLTRGKSSSEEIYSFFESYFPHKSDTVEKIYNNFVNSMYTREGMINLVKYLRENNFRTYLLSNTTPETAKIINSDDIKKYFDGVYCTSEHGNAKPEIEAYKKACKLWRIKPEESLFIDNKKRNTLAAQKVGFGDTFKSNNEKKIKKYLDEIYLDWRA